MTIQRKLARLLSLLDEIANDLDERGFREQMNELDEAGCKIEAVVDAFDGL
jgi:hypothetical protein